MRLFLWFSNTVEQLELADNCTIFEKLEQYRKLPYFLAVKKSIIIANTIVNFLLDLQETDTRLETRIGGYDTEIEKLQVSIRLMQIVIIVQLAS